MPKPVGAWSFVMVTLTTLGTPKRDVSIVEMGSLSRRSLSRQANRLGSRGGGTAPPIGEHERGGNHQQDRGGSTGALPESRGHVPVSIVSEPIQRGIRRRRVTSRS